MTPIKPILGTLALLATMAPHAPAAAASVSPPSSEYHAMPMEPTMGTHGMALFGGADGLFASHLPLFHPPHDRRILLRLEIADPAVDRDVRARLAASPALWTLVPERFALGRLLAGAADPIRAFRADIVQGHFERGGTTVLRDVPVRIVQVLENRPVAPSTAPPPTLTYRVVGAGHTWFLVKEIDARPDFDHVVALAPGPRPRPRSIHLPRHDLTPPTAAALGHAAGARVAGTIYYETDDLR